MPAPLCAGCSAPKPDRWIWVDGLGTRQVCASCQAEIHAIMRKAGKAIRTVWKHVRAA